MRVTDDRYNRDRLRLEIALRLIGHEARTQTIRRWTGLSDDRIRKLVRSYIRPGAGVRRHRGKSPQQVRFFLRGGSDDAHALAAMLLLFGVLPPRPAAARTSDGAPSPLPSLARGLQLCEAYEIYRRVVPQARIDFEHAVFLAIALPSLRRSIAGHCYNETRSLNCRVREPCRPPPSSSATTS